MCTNVISVLVSCLLVGLQNGVKVQSATLRVNDVVVRPPPAKYASNSKLAHLLPKTFEQWTEDSGSHVWEHAGYLEGDIMTYAGEDRNGILNKTLRWPDAVVPFYIDEKDFSEEEVKVILGALAEYHQKTCVKFRAYTKSDSNWVHIKGDKNGCWSSVGMHREGQVVNLHTPKCVRHGVVVHELLHALGFFHQQSATNRDDYVKIHWENISKGHEYNFNKYNESIVTSYGVGYDYDSVMHYSSKAFSKNGNKTIEALQPGVEFGQRNGLSEKDILKLNKMYRKYCQKSNESSEESDYDLFKDLIDLFG